MRDEPVFYTPKDIAKMLQVAHETVLRWIRAGKLHAVQLDGGYRVDKKDLDTFLRERRK